MSTATDAPPAIDSKLRGAWRRERQYFHTHGAAYLVFWVVGLFLFSLLVDWLFDLPGLARLVLLLVNLGMLGWAGWHWWVQYLMRYDATRVALQVERLHPGLNNLLVTYVQLNGQALAPAHGSPRLIEAMRQQAVAAASPLSFSGIINFRHLRKLLATSGGVLLVFAVSWLFLGGFYLVLIARMLNPFTELAYPTRTKIQEVTGPVAVKEGDPVQVLARAAGEVPEQGSIYVKYADASWERVPLDRGADQVFAFDVRKATQSFSYYFKIGDAKSQRRPVTVVLPPKVVAARVALRFPDYTGRKPEELQGLQLPPLPEGTEIAWELQLDQPLASGQMLLGREDGRPLELQIDAGDRQLARLAVKDVATLLPGSSASGRTELASYQFRWTESNHGFTFTDATRHSIEVIPDRPPILTLLHPRPRLEPDRILGTTRKMLDLIYEATDDYGLAEAWIVYRVNDEPQPRRHPLGRFAPGTASGRFESSWTLKDSLPGVKEGDLVTCEIEATDNRQGKFGPNLGRSRPIRVQIVNEVEYAQYIEKEKASGLEKTRIALQEETRSGSAIRTLLPPPPK